MICPSCNMQLRIKPQIELKTTVPKAKPPPEPEPEPEPASLLEPEPEPKPEQAVPEPRSERRAERSFEPEMPTVSERVTAKTPAHERWKPAIAGVAIALILIGAIFATTILLIQGSTPTENEAPIADAGADDTAAINVEYQFDGSASWDPDDNRGIMSYSWDFGNGETARGMSPTHAYEALGNFTVTLKVTDYEGATATDSMTVTVVAELSDYLTLTLATLLAGPSVYLSKLVKLADVTVTDAGSYDMGYGSDPSGWVKFEVSDDSTSASLEVYCEGGATRPLSLSKGDVITVQGEFIEYKGTWEIKIRKGSKDKATSPIPPEYLSVSMNALVQDFGEYEAQKVRLDAVLVADDGFDAPSDVGVDFTITDQGKTQSFLVTVEPDATRPTQLSKYDTIDVQGKLIWNTAWGAPEMLVRNDTNDTIALPTYTGYQAVNLSTLLRDPKKYSEQDVCVRDAIVTDAGSFEQGYGSDPSGWVKLSISDDTTILSAVVYAEGYATRPLSLVKGERVNVRAVFTWYSYGGYWELKVRDPSSGGAQDSIVKAGAGDYSVVSIGSLYHTPDDYENTPVYVENARISGAGYDAALDEAIWFNITTQDNGYILPISVEPNGTRPGALRANARVNVHGLFVWHDAMGSWSLKVRNATSAPDADDKVEVPVVVAYPVVTLAELFRDAAQYAESSVRLENVTVTDAGSFAMGYGDDPEDWVKFDVGDATSTNSIVVYAEGGASRPLSLSEGDELLIQGIFTSYRSGGYWELKVRSPENAPSGGDKIERPGLEGYELITVDMLLYDPRAYVDAPVRVENAIVVESWYEYDMNRSVTFSISNVDEELYLAVYVEPNATRPTYMVEDTIAAVQGVFNWNASYSSWMLVVRVQTEDIIERVEPEYVVTTVGALLENPNDYENKLVQLENVTIHETVWWSDYSSKSGKVKIMDNSSIQSLVVYCESYSMRTLSVSKKEKYTVKGMFQWYGYGGSGVWEIAVRSRDSAPTVDDMFKPQYAIWDVNTLVSQASSYKNLHVRVENAEVTYVNWYVEDFGESAKFTISDDSTTRSFVVYCESYSNIPDALAKGDVVNVQGVIAYYRKTWEIKTLWGDPFDRVAFPPPEPPVDINWTEMGWADNVASHVVISELLYDPMATDTGKEWVELYNPTDGEIDIGGWTVEALIGSGPYAGRSRGNMTIPANETIPAYGFYLIGASSGINPTPDYVPTTWVDFGDGPDAVRLKNATGHVIDTIGYGDINAGYTWMFEGTPAEDVIANAGYSLERLPGALDHTHGNGVDRDNNSIDFVRCKRPEPQNSQSAPEPPKAVARVADATAMTDNMDAQYVACDVEALSYMIWRRELNGDTLSKLQ